MERSTTKVYLVGGGLASMAAAAFMIRDGDILGHNITIFEELGKMGGSLDGSGSPEHGYVLRGGRMLESKYLCTFGLFSSIPTLDGSKTVTQEIMDWNKTMKTSSKSRLMSNCDRETAPEFDLSEDHIINLERLIIEPENMLGETAIADQFDDVFFKTNFWLMWCTTFAFQPWHSAVEFKRYLMRFSHMISGFNRLEGILRTVYNQYDSMVRPLEKWLEDHGVIFEMNARVTNLGLYEHNAETTVTDISYERDGKSNTISINPGHYVLVTLGSMTEASSLGSMDAAPVLNGKLHGGAWTLWEALALGRPEFGTPWTFDNHIDESKWLSFTITLRDPALLHIIRDLTGNSPGEGGLVTFVDSNWLFSVVVPYQPHFINQPDNVSVLWGYGLSIDKRGNFVNKPMASCTGRDIMTELLGHLNIQGEAKSIIENAICIPCLMPFITSQFLRRKIGSRPQVFPESSTNFAFVGQFCEMPDDTVFTVEYSIRSAQTAVYALLGLKREPPAVYKGTFDPRVLLKAFMALHDVHL